MRRGASGRDFSRGPVEEALSGRLSRIGWTCLCRRDLAFLCDDFGAVCVCGQTLFVVQTAQRTAA
jgi:hypothetical protein